VCPSEQKITQATWPTVYFPIISMSRNKTRLLQQFCHYVSLLKPHWVMTHKRLWQEQTARKRQLVCWLSSVPERERCRVRTQAAFITSTTEDEPGELSRYSDSLRDGRSGNRIPVIARFSAPFRTGPGAYPASYIMGTGSFPGVKRPGCDIDHPLPSSAKVKERGLYGSSPSGPSWPVLGWTF